MTAAHDKTVGVATHGLATHQGNVRAHPSPARHPPHAHLHHPGTFHRMVAHASTQKAAPAGDIPEDVSHALHAAMSLENVPPSWESGLRYIMSHESGGQVGVANNHDSARGLFQLTRASYGLNPNGAQSFGSAVEEAQGGIRYIRQRYQTADIAAGFWARHRYY